MSFALEKVLFVMVWLNMLNLFSKVKCIRSKPLSSLYIVGQSYHNCMQTSLKVGCPGAGFTGLAILKNFKQNGDFLGQTQINCPTQETVKFITNFTGGGQPHNWTIELTINNSSTNNTKTQSFNGRYDMSQPNTTLGNASVTLDGATLTAGTGWR
jgi:hypothetical protein